MVKLCDCYPAYNEIQLYVFIILKLYNLNTCISVPGKKVLRDSTEHKNTHSLHRKPAY